MRTAVTLVTGATGAGKTTLITRLLGTRPPHERWAVLVNDFGRASLAHAPGVAGAEVTVREVAGCMCCTGQVTLRAALVRLLRDTRLQRLFIEASAAAEPSALAKLLHAPGLASAIALERTVCVVDPLQAIDLRYREAELYRTQARAADVVLLTQRAGTGHAQRLAAREALAAFGSAPVRDEL